MKKSGKVIGVVILIVIIGIIAALGVTSQNGADPTGASYYAVSGKEKLADVAQVANKAYYGANFTWVLITVTINE